MATSLMRARHSDLDAVRSQWERAIELQAPGVLDLRLTEYCGDAVTRERLVAVLEEVESVLVAFGERVPLTHLKQICKVPGLLFEGPFPTRHLLAAVRCLLELVRAGPQAAS